MLGLLLIGFVMVYSTTSVELINDGKDPLSDLASQVEFALIGIVCVVILWKLMLPPPSLHNFAAPREWGEVCDVQTGSGSELRQQCGQQGDCRLSKPT